MNHDYAHCLDYTKDCPKECFRAELQRDIEENRSEFIGVPLTYAHLRGKEECELAKDTDVTDRNVGKWIPIKTRPMDSEEREYLEGQLGEELGDEDAVVFDCPMPKDGQEILVSYRKWINLDKCEIACGGFYELEGNGDWEGVVAWMPAPEPWKGEEI